MTEGSALRPSMEATLALYLSRFPDHLAFNLAMQDLILIRDGPGAEPPEPPPPIKVDNRRKRKPRDHAIPESLPPPDDDYWLQ